MEKDSSTKKTKITTRKKMLFTFFVLAGIFSVITVILSILERSKVIDTRRLDDIVTHPEEKIDLLYKVKRPNGEYFHIGLPEMFPNEVSVKKRKRTVRIFIYGGSFVLGSPYIHYEPGNQGPGTIPLWLKASLRAIYPDVNFEVCNLGAGGWNSTSVFTALKATVKADPDLIIVISGNNEGFVINSPYNKALQKWVLYRALKKKVKPDPKLSERPLYIPQDPDFQKIQKQYEYNIEQIIRVCKKYGIPLLLGTVPINYLYLGPAKIKETPTGLDFHFHESDEYIDRAYEYFKKGKYNKAISEAGKSKTTPIAIRIIAGILIEQGNYNEALEVLREFVQMRPQNRTRPSYNKFIREIAKKRNVPLVDLAKHLEQISPTGITDPSLFVDHCHMTWWGYKMVADLMLTGVQKIGVIPKDAKQHPAPTIEQLIYDNGWERIYQFQSSRLPIILDDPNLGLTHVL